MHDWHFERSEVEPKNHKRLEPGCGTRQGDSDAAEAAESWSYDGVSTVCMAVGGARR